jgi:hypothetical protein
MNREGVFSDTAKAVNIDDARQVMLQQAFSLGELPQVIGTASNDALFAASGNRFAIVNLIQNALTKPKQFIARHRAPETARLVLGTAAKDAINEMLTVLRAHPDAQTAGMIKRMSRVALMPPRKLAQWVRVEKNRRALYGLGTAASAVEQAALESSNEQ